MTAPGIIREEQSADLAQCLFLPEAKGTHCMPEDTSAESLYEGQPDVTHCIRLILRCRTFSVPFKIHSSTESDLRCVGRYMFKRLAVTIYNWGRRLA